MVTLRSEGSPMSPPPAFFGGGNGPEPPDSTTGLGIVGVQETADPELSTAGPNEDLPLSRERCHRERVAEWWLGDFLLPHHRAGAAIQRYKFGIQGAEEHLVV